MIRPGKYDEYNITHLSVRWIQHLLEHLPEFLNLRIYDHETIGLVRIVAIIVLMIPLGFVERIERLNLCHDGIGPQVGCIGFLPGPLRYLLLNIVMVQDG